MTKQEYYRENYEKLLASAKEELTDLLIKVIEVYGDDNNLNFYEHDISTPIFRASSFDDDMCEVICGAFINDEGEIGFTVDNNFGNDYDISFDNIDMEMTIYLIGELEDLNLEVSK